MNIYHIWANKAGDISDMKWCLHMREFLDKLVEQELMVSYRITRCKLGFRSIQDIPEWHIMMEFETLDQLDRAFGVVDSSSDDGLEASHRGFNQYVEDDIQHALYRDWPEISTSGPTEN